VQITSLDGDLHYPDAGDLDYLIGYLADIGYCRPVGEGIAVVSWQEVAAWAAMTGHRLTPFEAEAIRRFSGEYVGQYAMANGKDCAMPACEITADRREAVAKRAEAFLSMLRRPE